MSFYLQEKEHLLDRKMSNHLNFDRFLIIISIIVKIRVKLLVFIVNSYTYFFNDTKNHLLFASRSTIIDHVNLALRLF